MQPLAWRREKNEQREVISLGYNPANREEVKIHKQELLQSHLYIRGLTGSGKTRTLALLLSQIINKNLGKIIFIDPLGSVYTLMQEWISFLLGEYKAKDEEQIFKDKVLKNILFWDLSRTNGNENLKHNMLAPFEGEKITDVIARQIKFWDNVFSSESGTDGLDLQLQRRINLSSLISIFCALNIPLSKAREFIYDPGKRASILQSVEKLPVKLDEVEEAVAHFKFIDEQLPGARGVEKYVSLANGLAPLFESRVCRRFLMSPKSNVNFKDIFENKCLFVKLPTVDLPARKLLMTYLYTVFFDLADQRDTSKNNDTIFLGSDESALVFNAAYADQITRIRNKKVLLISAHQSLKQLLTPERMKIGETIEGQSRIRLYFQNSFEEAEKIVNESFTLKGDMPRHLEITTTVSKSYSEATGLSKSEQKSKTKTTATGENVQEGTGKTETKTISISQTRGIGETISEQFSQAEQLSQTESWTTQDGISFSEARTQGLQQISTESVTCTFGEGRSTTKIKTDIGSVTISESEGVTETISEMYGSSKGEGENYSFSESEGEGKSTNFSVVNGGQTVIVTEGAPIPTGRTSSGGYNKQLSEYKNASQNRGKSLNSSISQMQGLARSFLNSKARSEQQGYASGVSKGQSQQESIAKSKSLGEAVSEAKQYAQAIQKSLGQSSSFGRGYTRGRAVSIAKSRQNAETIQHANALSFQISQGWGASYTESMAEGLTYGKTVSHNLSAGVSLAISYRIVLYTINEQRYLKAKEINSLAPRMFYLCIVGEEAIPVRSAACYDLPTTDGEYDHLKTLIKFNENLVLGDDKLEFFDVLDLEKVVKRDGSFKEKLPEFGHVFGGK